MKFAIGLAVGFSFMVIWMYLSWKFAVWIEWFSDWLTGLKYR